MKYNLSSYIFQGTKEVTGSDTDGDIIDGNSTSSSNEFDVIDKSKASQSKTLKTLKYNLISSDSEDPDNIGFGNAKNATGYTLPSTSKYNVGASTSKVMHLTKNKKSRKETKKTGLFSSKTMSPETRKPNTEISETILSETSSEMSYKYGQVITSKF